MQRIPRHRLLAALLTFLSLIVVAMLPIGVASAASPSTSCPTVFPEEGTPFSNCILAISAPESVATGRVFTVHVAVTTDGSTVAKSDRCAKVDVSLFVTDGEGSATYIAKTSGGIATFSVVVTSSGTHSLTATATNTSSCHYVSDSTTFEAVDIPADQPIAPCPDNVSCVQTTSNTGSAATLFADMGTFDAAFGTFDPAHGCGDAGPADPNGVLTFLYTGTDSKTIIFALRSDRVTKGIGLYKICWRSLHEFTQLGGTDAPLVDGMFTGYLPSCKKDDVGPCVLFKTSGQHNVGFFGIRAPPDDPQAYPG
ncbi:MAG TPA: hypothetical protein VGT81_11125 [Casimicrobiaceae bacterium]|nr:hypothetical protein [Casimicrobiaceae bacterium]